jgi:hypothetical protein
MSERKYCAEMPERAYKLCLLGAEDDEIAFILGVHKDTIGQWRRDYKEFEEAFWRGRMIANSEVAHSMHRQACGFFYPEVKVVTVKVDKDTTEAQTVEVQRYQPPNVVAGIFWLKNKYGNRQKTGFWQDVTRQEHTGAGGGPIELTEKTDLSGATKEELKFAARLGFLAMGEGGLPLTIEGKAVPVEDKSNGNGHTPREEGAREE